MAFSKDQISRLHNLQEMRAYYKVNLNGLFAGESIICLKILDYIESQQDLTEESIFMIAMIYSEISSYDYLNGSGWFDFQIRLSGFLWSFGYDSDFNTEPGKMHIKKLTDEEIESKTICEGSLHQETLVEILVIYLFLSQSR